MLAKYESQSSYVVPAEGFLVFSKKTPLCLITPGKFYVNERKGVFRE